LDFVGLLAGAEFGHDWPSVAVNLQVLARFFFASSSHHRAAAFRRSRRWHRGHSDLRKVGRLGIKSLIYFEIVSTLAMLIGYAAIHISRAGEEFTCLRPRAAQTLNVSPHTRDATHHRYFPENIAKSVAEAGTANCCVQRALRDGTHLVPEVKRRPMLVFAESFRKRCSSSPTW